MNGQAESTDLHLPDIPRLTLRLPGGLTAQDSRIRIKSLVCDDSLIVFLRKFSYILQHVATGIRTTSLVKLLLRVIQIPIGIQIMSPAYLRCKGTISFKDAIVLEGHIQDWLRSPFLDCRLVLPICQEGKRITHEINYNKINLRFLYLLSLYCNCNYKAGSGQEMSLEKIKSAKNITYSDRYSKNPIINTLIKNKLETEMVSIKESFNNIIKKDAEDGPSKTTSKVPLRRNKSYSINPKSINQALQYNPIDRLNRMTEQFVAQRQVDSFLIPAEQLREINNAREEHSGLTTKLSKADVLRYDASETNLRQLSQKIKQRTVEEHDENVWLPGKPEVVYLIENRKEQIQEEFLLERKGSNTEGIRASMDKFTNRLTGKTFNLDSSSKKLQNFPLESFKSSNQKLKPVNYIPQKYHKNDYKLLEQWLDSTIEGINKEEGSPQEKLNLVYSGYICVWKQLIRLTYIQSEQKGLLIEKMFYSMLRLFWGLISEQQTMARNYQKQSQSEHDQIKKLMEHRMEELNKRHTSQVKQIEELKKVNHKLSKVFISFEKVNHQLVDELEKMTTEKKKYQREFYNIGNSFFKTLELLYDKKLIQMDFVKDENDPRSKKSSSQFKTYFLFDKNSKSLILGRFKSQQANPQPRYTHQPLEQTVSEQLKQYNSRYGHTLAQIENELSRYWQKKQDDLEMRGVINSLIMEVKIRDACVGTQKVQRGDFGGQFPEDEENYVERLLEQLREELVGKFQEEKRVYGGQIKQKEDMLLKWKQSCQEMQEKNKILQENNLKLNQNLKKSKQASNELVKQIDTLIKEIQTHKSQISTLQKDLQFSKSSQQLAKQNEETADRQRASMRSQLERQKENNRMLVRGNLEMKEKVQKFEIKFNTLVKAVKGVAPWLEKFMVEAERPSEEIDSVLLRTISGKIEEYLGEYVTKDSSLFMTRL